LDGELERLALEMAAAAEAGRPVSRWHIARLERYQSLMRQVGMQIRNYVPVAADEISQAQALMARWAIDHSEQLITMQRQGIVGQFNRLPIEAVQNMVGVAGNGSPLETLLRHSFGEQTPDVAGSPRWL
jgi:hypothetical protein